MAEDEIRCPKCNSTQISAGTKGFGLGKAAVGGILLGPLGLMSGFLGSNKIIVACLACGHSWNAGDKSQSNLPQIQQPVSYSNLQALPEKEDRFDSKEMIITPSGLKFIKVREGEGDETPRVGTNVTVHYVCTVLNGSIFDSSYDRNQPFNFPVGTGQVIKGLDEALLTMKKGEKRFLLIPPSLGYGPSGKGPVPPNATIASDIELIDFDLLKVQDTKPISHTEIQLTNKRSTTNAGESEIKKQNYSNPTKPQNNGYAIASGLLVLVAIPIIIIFLFTERSAPKKEYTKNSKQIESMPVSQTIQKANEIKKSIGTLKLESGMRYSGEILNGKANGHGKLTLSNGKDYDGLWRDGQVLYGFGIVKLNENSSYVGNVVNGVPDGLGKIEWKNGQYYEGNLRNGKPHGDGVFFNGSSTISGYFEDGKVLRINDQTSSLDALIKSTIRNNSTNK